MKLTHYITNSTEIHDKEQKFIFILNKKKTFNDIKGYRPLESNASHLNEELE